MQDASSASYNAALHQPAITFKRDFTKRNKCSMFRALTKIFDCIIYYSGEKHNSFTEKPRYNAEIKEKASKIQPSCFKKKLNQVIYTSSFDNSKKYISLVDARFYKCCSCSCLSFLKWAVCCHVVA
jgi:hypothetical protein